MGSVKIFSRIARNRFIVKWNLILWCAFILISLGFHQYRIYKYEENLEKEIVFREIESKKFENNRNYHSYSVIGINSVFIPSPCTVFFGESIVPENISARVDSMDYLNLRKNVVGKSNTPGKLLINLDFVVVVSFLLVLLSIYSGFGIGRSRSFQKFCQCTKGERVVFRHYLSQQFLFILAYAFFFAAHISLICLNGIILSGGEYQSLLMFFLSGIPMIIFFFACGAIIGNKKLRGAVTVVCMIASMLVMNFCIPFVICIISESKLPANVEEYKADLGQFVIISQFEIDAAKKYGNFSRERLEVGRKVMEYYYENVYPRMEALDKELYDKTANAAKWFRNLSIFTPGSFFIMTGSEVSSMGYGNLLGFYNHQIKLKKGFVRFYIDRTFYNDPKIMVNYIKSDENIYRAQTMVPDNFWWGFAINMFWGALFFFIAVRITNRRLNGSILKNKEVKDVRINLHYGKHTVVGSGNRDLIFYLMDALEGNARPGVGKITIDGKPVERGQKHDYIYIPTATFFPDDLKVGTLLDIIGEFAGLSAEGFEKVKSAIDEANLDKYIRDVSPPDELADMMMALAIASEKKFIIFDNISRNMLDVSGIMNTAKQLKENGILIIDFQDGTGRSAWGHLDGNFIFPYRDGTFINGREKIDELYSRFQSKG